VVVASRVAPIRAETLSARDALLRGTVHVARHVAPLWSADVAPASQRVRLTGNALRELDRFLNLLIDAASVRVGMAAGPDRRHAPNKLGALSAAIGGDVGFDAELAADRTLLMAVGRVRDCLHHCGGVVMRPGGFAATSGGLSWSGERYVGRTDDVFVPVGDALPLSARDLLMICGTYRRVARAVVALGMSVPSADAGRSAPRAGRHRGADGGQALVARQR
jgi:hypothetical protein